MPRVLITGGAGSIGSELARQLAVDNSVHIFDQNETGVVDNVEALKLKGFDVVGTIGDVRDAESLRRVFKSFKPDVVFHASALKHVGPAESFPEEYVRTNVLGTINVVRLCQEYEAQLINISTDKVVQAECIMGITKKVAEKVVRNAGYVSVRFGNVLGSRGSVIPFWQSQIDRGEPLTVTDERMERYMMSIPEACALLIKAKDIGKPGQILIMDMGQPVNVLDLAKKILKESGRDVGIKMIGIRPGEVLSERLMTDMEAEGAVKNGNFWILN